MTGIYLKYKTIKKSHILPISKGDCKSSSATSVLILYSPGDLAFPSCPSLLPKDLFFVEYKPLVHRSPWSWWGTSDLKALSPSSLHRPCPSLKIQVKTLPCGIFLFRPQSEGYALLSSAPSGQWFSNLSEPGHPWGAKKKSSWHHPQRF